MADKSLDDSASAGNLHKSSRIVFTHVLQGYAIIRVPLNPQLAQCKPSFIHDYLWSLSEAMEQMMNNFDATWAEKLKKSERR